jgi:hypothetical protein
VGAQPAALSQGRSPPETRNLNQNCALQWTGHNALATPLIEGTMATRQDRRIVETPTEARQGEPGPSVFALLTISTGLAILILGVVWFVFFRT